jgi:hypothetical protein
VGSNLRLGTEVVALLALCSAGLFGASSVLMHSRARLEPARLSLRTELLANLARKPVWLVGLGGQGAGLILQAVGLRIGSLVTVQALGPANLLVALPLAAIMLGAQMRRTEWVGVVATVCGLSAFLLVGSPHQGLRQPSPQVWTIIFTATLLLVVGLVVMGRRATGPMRAVAFATAAGALFAVDAALTKVVAGRFGHGVVSALGGWELYGLVLLLPLSLLLMQSSFQAGRIEWSLPALTVSNPASSLVIGIVAFHESLSVQGADYLILATSFAVTFAGVVILARTPTLLELHQPRDQSARGPDPLAVDLPRNAQVVGSSPTSGSTFRWPESPTCDP